MFPPPDPLSVALALAGAAVLAIAAFHRAVRRAPGVSAPLLATVGGVAVGPGGSDWVRPGEWGTVKEVMGPAAAVTLAVGLTGVALRLPRGCVTPKPHRRTALTLLGPGMLAAWAASSFLAWAVLGLDGWAAGLVGAAVVPTDPVLASAVVSGDFARDHLPAKLRHAISFESGANDGLAVPLVTLAAAGSAGSLATAGGWGGWFLSHVLWEAAGAVALGAACGAGTAAALRWGERHDDTDEIGLLAFGLALTLAVLGVAGLLGVSGPLATFAAGLAFAWGLPRDERLEEGQIQDAVNQFCLLPAFLLFGALLPWGEWAGLGWRGVLFAAAVLLCRRPPWVWLLGRFAPGLLPDLSEPRDRLFAGWFGPIGVAALYYAAEFGEDCPGMWPAVSLTVAASVAAHGATAAPLTRRYARAG